MDPYITHLSEPWWYGDSLFEFLVPIDATDGRLVVFRSTMPEGFSPPRHIHTREDEVFVIEAGDVTFDIDGRLALARPGHERVHAPWCAAHLPGREHDRGCARDHDPG